MMKKIIYSMLISCLSQPLFSMVYPEKKLVYGRVLPVHQSKIDGKMIWYGLFAKNNNDQYWNDFGQITKGEANIAAQNALATNTGNLYNIQIDSEKYPKIEARIGKDVHVFHFVPVTNWVKASDLYKKAGPSGTKAKADFRWLALDDISTDKSIARTIKQILNKNWPAIKAKLPTPSTSSSPTAQKPMPSSPLSRGEEKPSSWNVPGALFFYERSKPYYSFTNFYPASFKLDGKIWPTSEHYFQAQKSTDPKVIEHVRSLKAPRDTFNYFRQNKSLVRHDWGKVKIDIMKKAVTEKFSQNPLLKQELLDTGNAILVEDAGANDEFWGAGAHRTGANWLGRILMQVREKLRTNK